MIKIQYSNNSYEICFSIFYRKLHVAEIKIAIFRILIIIKRLFVENIFISKT